MAMSRYDTAHDCQFYILLCSSGKHVQIAALFHQVAKIETEKMLIQMVETELEKRKQAGTYRGQFLGQSHFFGYVSSSINILLMLFELYFALSIIF